MENILEVKSLSKNYKNFTLNNVSFNLPYGYIMGFIGPNGAGKTTTIKLIMNLIQKKSGRIRLFGLDNIKNEIEVKERIGFVYDSSCFYEHLSLKQMKSIIAPFYKKWDDNKFLKYIKDFDLPLNNKIRTLSKGMNMKFALAIALSHHADLIIMDEPTSGLDPAFRRELLEILSQIIQDETKSILFSTHITSDLERIADFITFIKGGNIVFSDSKDIILENWGIIKGGKELLNKDTKLLFKGYRCNEFGFEALSPDINKIKNKFKDKVIIEKASLEDIIYFVVKGNTDV